MEKIKISEEQLRKLKPVFESILSRKYGRDIKFTTLSIGDTTITSKNSKEGAFYENQTS